MSSLPVSRAYAFISSFLLGATPGCATYRMDKVGPRVPCFLFQLGKGLASGVGEKAALSGFRANAGGYLH